MARSKAAEKRYEAAGNRPGVQVTIRLSDDEIARLDAERGEKARAAFIKAKLFDKRRP